MVPVTGSSPSPGAGHSPTARRLRPDALPEGHWSDATGNAGRHLRPAPGRVAELAFTSLPGQGAFGAYVAGPDSASRASGLITVTVTDSGISEMRRFENSLFDRCGLPPVLEARAPSP